MLKKSPKIRYQCHNIWLLSAESGFSKIKNCGEEVSDKTTSLALNFTSGLETIRVCCPKKARDADDTP